MKPRWKYQHRVLMCHMVSLCVLVWATSVCAVDDAILNATLLEHLESGPATHLGLAGHGMDAASIDRVLSRIYHENGLQLLWEGDPQARQKAEVLRGVLRAAPTHGLDPEEYRLSQIERYWDSTDAVGVVRRDLLLTLALGGYVADAREGRINPRQVDAKLFATARDVEIDPVALVEEALTVSDLQAFLARQVPTNARYEELRQVLARYRAIAARGGWDPIPDGEALKLGMQDPRVPAIRQRLAITDDLQADDLTSVAYDAGLVAAVKHFQMRHGLDIDGVIGQGTRAALNIPVEAIIRRIIVNMERWRWLPHDLGGVRVGVNIAGFELIVFNDLKPENHMRVIVGKTYHKTPVFSDLIKYIEFNPYWNIPPSIARNEMLPKLKKNPRYLVANHMRLFSSWGADAKELDSTTIDWHRVGPKAMNRYKLRQDPGRQNALGTVKFVFPNTYNVYLHDTPSHALFSRSQRTFSHGCIRVSQPAELASALLGGEPTGWGIKRVKEVIDSQKRTVVRLEKPIPVHIVYRTVWFDHEGNVRFNEDIYGRDKLLEQALFQEP